MMSQITATAIATPTKDPLTHADRVLIAQVLTFDRGVQTCPDEVITIAISHGIVQVLLTGNRATLLDVEVFRGLMDIARSQEIQQQDTDIIFISELESKIQTEAEREEAIEVDCGDNGVYRVWKGFRLIGTFYHCSKTGAWTANPVSSPTVRRCKTAIAAQRAIIRPYRRNALLAA